MYTLKLTIMYQLECWRCDLDISMLYSKMSQLSCKWKCVRAFEDRNLTTAMELLPNLEGHGDIVCKYLGRNIRLVHCASYNGWKDIVELLTTQYGCDPQQKDDQGRTALHYAAMGGHLDLSHYLVLHCKCDLNARDNYGATPLHWAAQCGHLGVLQHLIECGGDIMATNDAGDTPFHDACQNNCNNQNTPVIKYLLSMPAVLKAFTEDSSVLSRDLGGDSRAVYDKFQRIQVSHPVGSFVNIFILGNPGAGKTTLCQAVQDRPKNIVQSVRHFFMRSRVRKVKLGTAGIVPNMLHDDSLGPVIVHDFAGQPEYYSSHAAILESLLQECGAIFVMVINLTQDLSQQVRFWSSIIINERQKAPSECHLIVVGSHADKVKDKLQHKMLHVESQIRKELASVNHSIAAIFPLDCRLSSKDNLQPFIESLSHLCTSLRNMQSPVISLYCNFLYSMLEAQVDNACSLEKLVSLCNQSRQEGVPLPHNIVPLLKTLHSCGLIAYLENKEDLPKSWVIVSKEIFLTEVDGILFAPAYFAEHSDIASNTGIITSSALQQLFPHYSSDMLIQFLKSMKLCEQLDEIVLKVTNLECDALDVSSTDDQLLFFPALITEKRPEHIKKSFKIWWCLTLALGYSFSVRFLHILLLHFIHQYSQSVSSTSANPLLSASNLKRQCSVWINGIHWYNGDGIETLVEQIDDDQCVMVLMSCHEGAEEKMIQLHCELIKTIVQLQQKYCPVLQCKEYLLAPRQEYPLENALNMVRYDMDELKSLIHQDKTHILCLDATDTPAISITELLPIKPQKYLSIYKVS